MATKSGPTDAEIGAAVRLLASFFIVSAGVPVTTAPAAKTEPPKDAPKDPPAQAETPAAGSSTPEAPKADDAEAQAAFVKQALDINTEHFKADNGATLKAIMAQYGVERLSTVPADKREEFIGKLNEKALS